MKNDIAPERESIFLNDSGIGRQIYACWIKVETGNFRC